MNIVFLMSLLMNGSNCNLIEEYIMDGSNNSTHFVAIDSCTDITSYMALKIYYYYDRGYYELCNQEIRKAKSSEALINDKVFMHFSDGIQNMIAKSYDDAIINFTKCVNEDNLILMKWSKYFISELSWELDPRKALALLNEVILMDEHFWWAIKLKGLIMYPSNLDSIYSNYINIPARFRDSETYRLLGDIELYNDNVKESELMYAESILLDSTNAYAYFGLGTIYQLYRSDYRLAIFYYSDALKYIGDEYFENLYTQLGWSYYHLADYNLALKWLNSAFKIKKTEHSYNELILYYLFIEDIESVIDLNSDYIVEYPSSIYPIGFNYMLNYLIPKLETTIEAQQELNRLMQNCSEEEKIWLSYILDQLRY